MITFTMTRSAADQIGGRTSSAFARAQALVLLKRLGSCETALAAVGEDQRLVQSLLRGLVLCVEKLAGPSWLVANAEDPDIAAFTALGATPAPPPPADLDEILARVLWARFATFGSPQIR
jgi:hypothetical protein